VEDDEEKVVFRLTPPIGGGPSFPAAPSSTGWPWVSRLPQRTGKIPPRPPLSCREETETGLGRRESSLPHNFSRLCISARARASPSREQNGPPHCQRTNERQRVHKRRLYHSADIFPGCAFARGAISPRRKSRSRGQKILQRLIGKSAISFSSLSTVYRERESFPLLPHPPLSAICLSFLLSNKVYRRKGSRGGSPT